MKNYNELRPEQRVLMGPGPSNADPRVLKAMATPLIGHLDPDFLEIMDETMSLLRYVFQTENKLTIPMSGTGSAGMETCLVNILEPGDKAIVAINGLFGQRMAEIVDRCGAEAIIVEAEWGKIIDPADIKKAFAKNSSIKMVCLVHAETSTGVRQPLTEIAEIAHSHDALLVADTVTSLGGIPVELDEKDVDITYSGTQKCLSCPPGLAPVSFNERAEKALQNRSKKVQSWYLDLTMIRDYWGQDRSYHHTAPISMIYALHEALRLVEEEGLEARYQRHYLHGKALGNALEAMGLELLVEEEKYRLPQLTAVKIPEGVDDAFVRSSLINDYNIEIGGGLGVLAGKLWRIGLMGASSTRSNVFLFLSALGDILSRAGYDCEKGAALSAAADYYDQNDLNIQKKE